MSGTLGHGRFLTLEGGEGAGKSTQLRALAAALAQRGKTVVTTREPGGSSGAEDIRALLLARDSTDWLPAAEALLFAAARSDHVARVIRPALERGEWVICDRYIDSTRAYQGGEGALSDADIMTLHRIGSGGLMPDRTLLLRLDSADADERRAIRDGAGGDRFEDRDQRFHARVTAAFDHIAQQEPDRVRRIDALGPADTVTARMMAALADLL